MKKISVIIPVYNLEKYISRCLDSILKQNFDDIEIILVNDGSRDKSLQILKEYEKKYPKLIKVINKKNGGQGSARNEGIKAASGKYINFVDGDDWLEPETYSKAYRIIEEKKLDILFWDIKLIYEDGKEKKQSIFSDIKTEDMYVKYLFSNPSPCNKLIRTSILKKNDMFFPEDCIYEDFAMIPSLVKYAKKIEYTDTINYNYWQRTNSTMKQVKYNNKFMDILKAFDYLKNSMLNSKYSDEIEYLAIFQLAYYHSFRFMQFNKFKEVKKCYEYLNKFFPNWKTNKYFLLKQKYFKIYVSLLNNNCFFLAKILYSIRKILRG